MGRRGAAAADVFLFLAVVLWMFGLVGVEMGERLLSSGTKRYWN